MDAVAPALLHLYPRLGEARNHLADHHRHRGPALARIEHRAVFEPAFIIDQHTVLRADPRARTGLDGLDLDGPAPDRLRAEPGEADAGGDDDEEAEPQLHRPAGPGGSMSGF